MISWPRNASPEEKAEAAADAAEREEIMRDWKKWIKAAGVRALKTVAQTAVATIGTAAALGQVNWAMVASASVLAGVISMLTSLAGLPEVDNGNS